MNIGRGFNHGLLIALIGSLVACSGGGELADNGDDGGGTGGTGVVSRGPVSAVTMINEKSLQGLTAAATVTVNGVVYDVSDASLSGAEEILPGMIVTVKGKVAGAVGTANSIDYNRNLLGVVSGFAGGSSFTLYGQDVVVDNLTAFEPEGSWFDNGAWVEVSGFVLDGGVVRASFIKAIAGQNEVEIEGFVSDVPDAALRTLKVGGATVHVPPGVGPDFGQFSQGDYVEVHADPNFTAGTLTAKEISIEDTSLGGEEGDEAEIEGVINAVDGAHSTFVVAGQQVAFDNDTEFSGGAVTDLVPGVKVEVEGSFVGGVLVVHEISFEDPIELTDKLSAVSGDTITFALGIDARLDPVLTEGYGEQTWAVNDVVRIRGRVVDGVVLATKIEREGENGKVELQGPVSSINSNISFTILEKIEIVASDIEEFEIDGAEEVTSQATFFSQLATGDLVGVAGVRAGDSAVNWIAAELE